MIFDCTKKVKYETNTEALKKMGIDIKKGTRPTYIKLKGHENEFVSWFNYVAIVDTNGDYKNPSNTNEYINVYEDNDDKITQIDPSDKSWEDDGLIRIVFKKLGKNEVFFSGLYACFENNKKERKTIFKRISTIFDSNNIYSIEPTDYYYEIMNNPELINAKSYKILEKFKSIKEKAIEEKTKALDVKTTLSLEEKSDEELNKEINNSDDLKYKFVMPKIEKIENSSTSYKRNRQIAINAITLNGCKCDFNESHNLFFKTDGRQYIEVHHIIPMNAQKDFDIPLDREENIVCLCPNCHREIHYGRNKKKMIADLLSKKKDTLDEVGLKVAIDDVLKYYE